MTLEQKLQDEIKRARERNGHIGIDRSPDEGDHGMALALGGLAAALGLSGMLV